MLYICYRSLYPRKPSFGVYRNHPVCLSVGPSIPLSRVNLTLNITFKPEEIGLPYYTYSLLQDLSGGTKTFDLYFWPTLKKKLNLGFNFWIKRDGAFMLPMCIPCHKTFLSVSKLLTLLPWPWLLALSLKKKLNLVYNFWTKRDRAFILPLFIPCQKTFLSVQKLLTYWPWLLTYFWKI